MALTQEQKRIIASEEDLVINAVAGSGKTTTILEYARRRTNKRILYLVFNKSVEIPLQDLLAVLRAQNEYDLPLQADKNIDISSIAARKYLERELEVTVVQCSFAVDLIGETARPIE